MAWFYELSQNLDSPVDIHYDDDILFFDCCSRQSAYNKLKWLYNLSLKIGKPYDIYNRNELALYLSCHHCRLPVAEWLYELSHKLGRPYNIRKEDDKLFLAMCRESWRNGRMNIIEWLCELCDSYSFKYDAVKECVIPTIHQLSKL
jgi:hypothetical protein